MKKKGGTSLRGGGQSCKLEARDESTEDGSETKFRRVARERERKRKSHFPELTVRLYCWLTKINFVGRNEIKTGNRKAVEKVEGGRRQRQSACFVAHLADGSSYSAVEYALFFDGARNSETRTRRVQKRRNDEFKRRAKQERKRERERSVQRFSRRGEGTSVIDVDESHRKAREKDRERGKESRGERKA